jgi:hypothetical protein
MPILATCSGPCARARVPAGARRAIAASGLGLVLADRGNAAAHGRHSAGALAIAAAASADVREEIGRVTLSIPDDTCCIKPVRRGTGAEALPADAGRTGARKRPLAGPVRAPECGSVTYRGRTYLVFSFRARAFPSGPVRVSLLVAATTG